eukprot:2806087-Rhodomonas_salina.1
MRNISTDPRSNALSKQSSLDRNGNTLRCFLTRSACGSNSCCESAMIVLGGRVRFEGVPDDREGNGREDNEREQNELAENELELAGGVFCVRSNRGGTCIDRVELNWTGLERILTLVLFLLARIEDPSVGEHRAVGDCDRDRDRHTDTVLRPLLSHSGRDR